MIINKEIKAPDLKSKVARLFQLSGEKIMTIKNEYNHDNGSPVFTVGGKYSTRGWTEWTQGFEFGSSIIQFDATGDADFLEIGRSETLGKMDSHLGHFGVHDHGFNNLSTYGNLLRLMKEGKIAENEWERNFYILALRLSGSVQAKRWTPTKEGGYVYSFNGPHSLFVDTIRSMRSLVVSHELGYALWEDHDVQTSLLERSILHNFATADYAVYYGESRDSYDIRGRTAHESVFNTNDGNYRCPNTQQGYSGFSTWTRGLAWAITGYAEQLEYIDTLSDEDLSAVGGKTNVIEKYLKAAQATCDFYIVHTPTDGIPYWDTGAPNLHRLGDYLSRASDPYNDFEPIDSSAAAIAGQGFLRLAKYLKESDPASSAKYLQAGLTIVDNLFQEPYISTDPAHQGLLLHSIYHQPNGWDHVPEGSKIANGESSMWGDYHARELALYLHRIIEDEPYYTFFRCAQ